MRVHVPIPDQATHDEDGEDHQDKELIHGKESISEGMREGLVKFRSRK